MSGGNIFTPTNQKRLTNVAVVRLSKGGHRFEVACYKNKVLSWRDGTETDINEVLQVCDVVYTNVSKGEIAKKDLLLKCFKTANAAEVCLTILNTGDLQVSEKERKELQANLLNEIANIVAEKCVDSETEVALQPAHILNAMKEIHFSVKPNQSAKKQALELIPKLSSLNIKRANMKVRVTMPSKEGKKIKSQITELMLSVDSEEHGVQTVLMGAVLPGNVKTITELVQSATKGKGAVEVLSLREVAESEAMV